MLNYFDNLKKYNPHDSVFVSSWEDYSKKNGQ